MAQNNLEIQISAKADRAVKSLDDLVNKLNQVNSALNSINTSGLQNIANSLKGINGVKINVNSKNGLNEATRSMSLFNTLLSQNSKASKDATSIFARYNSVLGKFASTWGMVRASIYPFLRLGYAIKKSTISSMDFVETFNYLEVAMKRVGDKQSRYMGEVGRESAEKYSEGYMEMLNQLNKKMTGFNLGKNGELISTDMKSLGIDPNILMNFQARIGAVTSSVGLLGDATVSTQKALSMLSADLSSLTNTDLDTVMTNLSSGLIGQSRALYKYGIDITNTKLKEYAEAQAITKKVSAMTQAEKMQLRMLAILDQSKVAWGDQANKVEIVDFPTNLKSVA